MILNISEEITTFKRDDFVLHGVPQVTYFPEGRIVTHNNQRDTTIFPIETNACLGLPRNKMNEDKIILAVCAQLHNLDHISYFIER